MDSATMWARSSGPLGVDAVGYADELTGQGYAERTVEDHLRLIAELDRWMASEALSGVDLTPERLEQFIQAKQRAGHHWLSQRRLKPLLDHIRVKSVPPSVEPGRATALYTGHCTAADNDAVDSMRRLSHAWRAGHG